MRLLFLGASTRQKLWSFCLGLALILLFQVLNARGLFSSYSYWNDEAFSVATAQANWSDLFNKWVIPDTAPPLYPVMLKLWISLLGSTETTARLLSFIAATVSMFVLSFYCRRFGNVSFFSAIIFLGTSPLFSRYGQESRNYALVLLLASISLTSLLATGDTYVGARTNRSSLIFRSSIVLLSLTHYFSFIYSIALLAYKIISDYFISSGWSREGRKDLITLLVALVWPFFHLVIARPVRSTTLLGWNYVQPLVGTVANLAKSMFSSAEGNFAVCVGIVLLIAVFTSRRSHIPIVLKRQLRILLVSTSIFVIAVIAIDLLTNSFSTDRNFIVVLPACTLIVSIALQAVYQTGSGFLLRAATLFAAIFIAIQQYNVSANNLLFGKVVPFENLKQISVALDQANLCKESSCFSVGIGPWWRDVYFSEYNLMFSDLLPGQRTELGSDAVILTTGPEIDQSLLDREGNSSRACFQPIQHWDRAFVLIAQQKLVESKRLKGLKQILCSSVETY